MLADLLLGIIVRLLGALIGRIPSVDPLPEQSTTWVGYLFNGISMIGWLLPLDQIAIILGLMFGLEGAYLIFLLLLWIFKKLTGH